MKRFNSKGITILSIIFLVAIIVTIVIYAPKAYEYILSQNTARIVRSNVEAIESEIRTELIDRHPVHIWNNIDALINNLNLQNPVTLEKQTENGWDEAGEVVVSFNGSDTFLLDGIGRDGVPLHLNIVIQKS